MTSYTSMYLDEVLQIISKIDLQCVEALADGLASVRSKGGRLFILGVGGSAGHASHAVNDFRKLCNFEAYAPTDNISELTARTNDEGWDTTFVEWLKGSRLKKNDAILIFSVGGGNLELKVSTNIINAIDYAIGIGSSIYSIVGRDGGYSAKKSTYSVVIPQVSAERVTPHTEGLTAVVWHLLVSHPRLQVNDTKW